MKRKFIKIETLAVIILLTMFTAVNLASAAGPGLIKDSVKNNIGNNAQSVGGTAGYEEGTADSALILVQTLINVFLSIIGVLLLAFILYAGYNWLTAEGEEEKVQKAKDTLKRAIIGAIIIIAAYAISTFVMSRIEQGTLRDAGTSPVGTVTP